MTQIERLILEPIRKMTLSKPVALAIDALDECDNSVDPEAKLFCAVVERCTEVSSICLLVTSRPGTYIKSILAADQVAGIVLHEDVEQSVVSEDIRRYLSAELSRMRNRLGVDLPLPWPPKSDLNALVSKLFIWAATAIRFVGDGVERDPASQLRILLGTPIGPNGNTQNPFTALDNLYVTSSQDGIIVVNVQTGVLRHTRYPFGEGESPNESQNSDVRWAGISFDSSRIAAVSNRSNMRVWDLYSGTLLHAHDDWSFFSFGFRWSRTDLHLLYDTSTGHRYLNPETFKEGILEKPGDRFQEHDHLYCEESMLQIRSFRRKNRRNDPLFLALPSHLNIKAFCWHDDRVCILSAEGRLLLKISCLDAYITEYCRLESEPEGELRKDILYSLVK